MIRILLPILLILGPSFLQGEEDAAAIENPVEESLDSSVNKQSRTISESFVQLWESTGIYRFFNPVSREEKEEAYRAALIKTVDAEISSGHFDGVFSLDVLEHIVPENEGLFLENCLTSLDSNGMAIFGMPSLESQEHASAQSKAGHINCKSGVELMDLMSPSTKPIKSCTPSN